MLSRASAPDRPKLFIPFFVSKQAGLPTRYSHASL